MNSDPPQCIYRKIKFLCYCACGLLRLVVACFSACGLVHKSDVQVTGTWLCKTENFRHVSVCVSECVFMCGRLHCTNEIDIHC